MKAIFIRHGKPDYTNVDNWGRVRIGHEFAPLSKEGIEQANLRASDESLKDAQIIVASPYTRALQTAAIISLKNNIKIIVEEELHEWFPDKDFEYNHKIRDVASIYFKNKGIKKDNKYNYEEYSEVKKRVFNVLEKYKNYKKVIFVCHWIVITAITDVLDEVDYCGIREIDYK